MLYIVPTPIGNLKDITYRAVEILQQVNLILAEDTRITGKLLKAYNIQRPMKAFHAHNEHRQVVGIVEQLQQGGDMALVSDAGTPGISDPGFLLVRACVEADVPVNSLPGATAFVPALVNSGLPTDRFVYEGFLPHKKGRQTRLKALCDEKRTIVLYESPHRLVKCLHQLAEHLGESRSAAVCRELTKLHEETQRGTLAELAAHYENRPPKGEIVICVAGHSKK